MTATVISPRKSTNVRAKNVRREVRRRLMRVYGALLPERASRLFERRFLSPRRTGAPVPADGPFAPGRARRVPYAGRWLKVWEAGSGERAILLVHGWAGQAAQFEAFVRPLTEAGFRVVAFDAPAHGLSDGERTDMIDFAGAILQIAGRAGPVHGIVAHSFGAPAAALALCYGLGAGRFVAIAPPTSLELYSRLVSGLVGVTERVRARMQRRVERRFGIAWRDLETHRTLAAVARARPLDLLVVHDSGDREVPWSSGAVVTEAVPGARMLTTNGLGHVKPLRDPATIDAIVEFLRDAEEARLDKAG